MTPLLIILLIIVIILASMANLTLIVPNILENFGDFEISKIGTVRDFFPKKISILKKKLPVDRDTITAVQNDIKDSIQGIVSNFI